MRTVKAILLCEKKVAKSRMIPLTIVAGIIVILSLKFDSLSIVPLCILWAALYAISEKQSEFDSQMEGNEFTTISQSVLYDLIRIAAPLFLSICLYTIVSIIDCIVYNNIFLSHRNLIDVIYIVILISLYVEIISTINIAVNNVFAKFLLRTLSIAGCLLLYQLNILFSEIFFIIIIIVKNIFVYYMYYKIDTYIDIEERPKESNSSSIPEKRTHNQAP